MLCKVVRMLTYTSPVAACKGFVTGTIPDCMDKIKSLLNRIRGPREPLDYLRPQFLFEIYILDIGVRIQLLKILQLQSKE